MILVNIESNNDEFMIWVKFDQKSSNIDDFWQNYPNLPKNVQKSHNFVKNDLRQVFFGIVLYFVILFR